MADGGLSEKTAEQDPLMPQLIVCNTFEEAVDLYNRTATRFDRELPDEAYKAPRLAAEALLRMYPECGAPPRSQLRVIDIAAGTGRVGQLLHDAGMTNLDALDPSSGMVAVAKSRGVYRRTIIDSIGHHRIDVEDNTYDGVTLAGAFSQGHCPVTALDEMMRICKPGGYIVIVHRMELHVLVEEGQKLMPHMDQLVKANKWRRLELTVVDDYFETYKQGVVFVFQKV